MITQEENSKIEIKSGMDEYRTEVKKLKKQQNINMGLLLIILCLVCFRAGANYGCKVTPQVSPVNAISSGKKAGNGRASSSS